MQPGVLETRVMLELVKASPICVVLMQVVATLVGVVIIDRIDRRAVLLQASIQACTVAYGLLCPPARVPPHAVLGSVVLCCAVPLPSLCCLTPAYSSLVYQQYVHPCHGVGKFQGLLAAVLMHPGSV